MEIVSRSGGQLSTLFEVRRYAAAPVIVYAQLGQLLAGVHRIAQPAYGYLTDQIRVRQCAHGPSEAQHPAGLCHNDFHKGNVLVDPGTWRVRGFVDVENAIAADPLMDLAKTECYSIRGNADMLAGLIDGYGELPVDWRARTTLYRLYHSLELWDWFKSIGTVDPLDSIAGDLAEIVRP